MHRSGFFADVKTSKPGFPSSEPGPASLEPGFTLSKTGWCLVGVWPAGRGRLPPAGEAPAGGALYIRGDAQRGQLIIYNMGYIWCYFGMCKIVRLAFLIGRYFALGQTKQCYLRDFLTDQKTSKPGFSSSEPGFSFLKPDFILSKPRQRGTFCAKPLSRKLRGL